MGDQGVRCNQLSNGLTVIRIDRPGWPVLTADVWVATGSADEAPEQAGISHFLEHMMFKGTATRGPGELDRIVEGVGGYWNAGTSKDFTHYYLTVPAEHRALALDALSDATLRSVIAPNEVENERRVILEEWRRSEDNPQQLLYSRIYETAHGGGPYRWPVIGHRETIESITQEQLAAYHRGRYRPESMALLLAGPVGDDEVLAELEEHFTWPGNGASDATGVEIEDIQWAPGSTRAIPKDLKEVYLAVAWPAPAASDTKAMVAMDVAQYILGTGRASRLYQRLHEEERLVTTIAATYPPHRTGGVFMVLATCEPDKAEAARDAIVREVAALGEARPAQAEGARARRLLGNHHVFGRETTSGHTSSVGHLWSLTRDAELDDRYGSLVEKVTAPAVTKAAAAHLTAEAAVTVAVHPRNHPMPWCDGEEENEA